jgi:hypothetical protein
MTSTLAERMQEAKVRVRAKAFASHLRTEGWAELIPEVDQEWLQDSEIQLYRSTLISCGCIQRPDMRWEFQR